MLDYLKEAFREFEENKVELSIEQKDFIKNRYNKALNFEYAEGHLCYIFKTTQTQYNYMLHYLGLEYENEEIESIVKIGGKVFVVYNNCERLDSFIQELQSIITQ